MLPAIVLRSQTGPIAQEHTSEHSANALLRLNKLCVAPFRLTGIRSNGKLEPLYRLRIAHPYDALSLR
jgi:hypothetical protein